MLKIFGMEIKTNYEIELETKMMLNSIKHLNDVDELCNEVEDLREENEKLKEASITLRDDIMRLDLTYEEYNVVNKIMDLIDKNFGEEEIPETTTATVDVDFNGNF